MGERNPISEYNSQGIADVLAAAENLIGRAAVLHRSIRFAVTPPVVSAAYRKEADTCLSEAIALIELVKGARP